MEKFASRAMLQIIEAGIINHGYEIDSWKHEEHTSALVPKSEKTSLLTYISNRYGFDAIFKLADGCDDVSDDPLRVALLKATCPIDLLERWSRIQEHVHSNHRIEWSQNNNGSVRLVHISLDEIAPKEEETCFVMSVLIKLMQLISVTGLNLESKHGLVCFDSNGWSLSDKPVPLTPWTLTYENCLESSHQLNNVTDYSQRVIELVKSDPCNRWNIERAAKQLCISTRTLQRRLKEERKSFQRLISVQRASIASEILVKDKCSLAEVGFLCGYASSAHFSSSFLKETAFTPRQFREKFQ